MPVDPLSIGATVGGGAISAIGGFFGAQSANRAGRAARDYQADRFGEGMRRYANTLYGQRFNSNYGGGLLDGAVDPFNDPNDPGLFARDDANLKWYKDKSNNNLSAYDQDRTRITGLAKDAETIAQRFGDDAERLIDEDAAESLRGANRTSSALLTARGMGSSSLVGNQVSANAKNIGRDASKAKVGVRQATTDRVLGARTQRLGVDQGMSDRLSGLRESFANNASNISSANTGRRYSAITNPVLNPWLGGNTAQYYPGTSTAGTVLSGVGNTLASAGAAAWARQSQQPAVSQSQFDSALNWMDRYGGGF